MTKLPKNRKDLLKQWNKVCAERKRINDKYDLLRGLFSFPPYNGQK